MDAVREIGPYRITRTLGSGGMGVVYEAWDTRLDRRVAIKLIHDHLFADPAVLDAFNREAKHAARIEHPNVVRVYHVDDIDGRVVIEMQFIDGVSLDKLLRSRSLPPDQAADLLRQVLEALQACHGQGVIHCDLKPGNLLVADTRGVVLTDFGIAHALYEAGTAPADSEAGPLWGTPHYTPPEAWTGGTVTPKWDMYAAGALTYEALTGAPPYRGKSAAAIVNAVRTSNPLPLQNLCPQVSCEFANLIETLMAREPEDRPDSAQTALVTLRKTPEFSTTSPATVPLGELTEQKISGNRVSKTRKRTWMVLGVLIVVAGLFALFSLILGNGKTKPEEAATAPAAAPSHRTDIGELVVVGNDVFFAMDDGLHGREMWWASSTEAPVMLKDIVPGPGSSDPRRFLARPHGGFVFAATTPETGEELWWAGSPVGGKYTVRMIKDIIPGPMASNPQPVAAQNALVLFYATTLAAGRELWCTNVQEQQTGMVADIFPGVDRSMPMNPRVYPDENGAYIVALADARRGFVLFRYDFKTHATHEVGDVAEDTAGLARAGRRILFPNLDVEHGKELWAYDEDTGALALVADQLPGPQSSNPTELMTLGNRVLFQAHLPETGTELYVSDGTEAGTRLLADINPGPADSDPYGFVVVGPYAFIRARDDARGNELWVTDGTTEGTSCVADIMPGPESGEPYSLTPYGSSLIFSARDDIHGEELWGAFLVKGKWTASLLLDIEPGPLSSEPHQLRWCKDGRTGFFLATLPDAGEVLYRLETPGIESAAASGWAASPVTSTMDHPP